MFDGQAVDSINEPSRVVISGMKTIENLPMGAGESSDQQLESLN